MNWKPFFKPREKTQQNDYGKKKERASHWLDQVIVRQVQIGPAGVEWDGEYAFQARDAGAYQRMQRVYHIVGRRSSGDGVDRASVYQLICDRPEGRGDGRLSLLVSGARRVRGQG